MHSNDEVVKVQQEQEAKNKKKIFQEVQAERERLDKLRNQYQKAIADLETQFDTLKS